MKLHTQLLLPFVVFALLASLYQLSLSTASAASEINSQFWDHWSDGKAEINSYQTVQPRYGENREGTAVSIFVTEPFSLSARVKADPGKHPASDVVSSLKLNLVEDFPTGIYDYNLMTSSFVSLEQNGSISPSSLLKVSFSSQEWCGNMYAQLLPSLDMKSATHEMHSYFDGEADSSSSLPLNPGWVSEDALFHWARGLIPPYLDTKDAKTAPLLRSLKQSRLKHLPVVQQQATFSSTCCSSIPTSEMGNIEAVTKEVKRQDGFTYTFIVERAFPNRILEWRTSEGFQAKIVQSKRIAYWEKNDAASISLLKELGLHPRPANTP